MRFIKELFKPRLKCERIGHQVDEIKVRGYSKPSHDTSDWRYYVAMDAEKITSLCTRCGLIHKEEVIASYKGLTGYSWPQSMADEFEKTGFVAD